MDAKVYFIFIFSGLIGFSWLSYQLFGFVVFAWRPIIRWVRRHFILPTILHGEHVCNPTRAEAVCYVVHWTSMIIFNTCKVSDTGEAAARAAYAAVIHILPLVFSGQVSFVFYSFGISPKVGLHFHGAFGFMAAVQGTLHGTLKLLETKVWTLQTKLGLLALCGLIALSLLAFARSRAYETFLLAHRVLTIVVALGLWLHLKPQQSVPRHLCLVTLSLFLTISCFRYTRQILRNFGSIRKGFRLVRIEEVRKHDDCLVLALQMPKNWRIRPGQHIFLTILTLKHASIFQRHPFTVAWWDTPNPSHIHLMIRSRRGWTKRIIDDSGFLLTQAVWLDGPFGIPLRLENYGAVLLFASGDGIFAQLPLIKALTEAYKSSSAKTRKIKLVWLTTELNEQLQEWIQTILDDEDLHTTLLDISVHRPNDAMHVSGGSKINNLGRRLKIIYDVPNVRHYLHSELRHLNTDVAVTVSAYPQLRHDVQNEVLKIDQHKVRLFELDYQPHDKDQYKSGTAA